MTEEDDQDGALRALGSMSNAQPVDAQEPGFDLDRFTSKEVFDDRWDRSGQHFVGKAAFELPQQLDLAAPDGDFPPKPPSERFAEHSEDRITIPMDAPALLQPPSQGGGVSYLTVALGFLSLVLHLGALPLVFTKGNLPAITPDDTIFLAALVAGAYICGVGSVRERIGVCYISFLLGMCCTVVCIVFFWKGGFTGMRLLMMPELNDCSVGQVQASLASSSPPSLFRCGDGFLDANKTVNISVGASSVLRMAPVYLDEERTMEVPALLALVENEQELEWEPCGSFNHSHGHQHEGDTMTFLHSHDHIHTRICGFAINVRHTISALAPPSELLAKLRETHVSAGGEAFEVNSIPVVDLTDPTPISADRKVYCAFALACYSLSLLAFCACCLRSIFFLHSGVDIIDGRVDKVEKFQLTTGKVWE